MDIKIIHMSLKMTIAGVVSLLVAYFIGITNYTTASAIAILSIQWTRREFVQVAVKRIISGLIGVILVAIIFIVFGINFWAYAIFLIFFTFISWILKIPEGIVPTVVLSTHFLFIATVSMAFIGQELGILIIAIVTALLVNMFYPQFNVKKQIHDLYKVDEIIKIELDNLVNKLSDNNLKYNSMEASCNLMVKYMEDAKMIDKDTILQNDHRYLTYLYMRKTQLDKLVIINNHIASIKGNHPHKQKIADFLYIVSNNIGFDDRASKLKDELMSLHNYFINTELPKDRKEFELRAMLFQILNEIDTFLTFKIDFHNQYPNFGTESERIIRLKLKN